MEQIRYQTATVAAAAGMADVLEGTLEIGEFDLGFAHYAVPEPARYRITLSNVGDAIVVGGTTWAEVHGECARCLEEARESVESEIEGYLTLREDSDVTGMEDDEYELVPDNGEVDLAPYVLAAIVVEIPPVFLCSEDCKGLCPTCGCNRNLEECSCDGQIDEFNPFFALKDFFKDDE